MRRRDFLSLTSLAIGATALPSFAFRWSGVSSDSNVASPLSGAGAQAATHEFPIIDVHLHAYPADMALPAQANPMTGKLTGLKNGEEHLQACLAEMKRLNVVKGVVSGGDGDRIAAALHWQETDRSRIIAAAGIRGSEDTPLPDIAVLRKDFKNGQLHVLGEITAQYAGLSLSDAKYEPYLALAEEFDIPVALHTGLGPPGISFDPCCRGFRASLGNPMLIEDALNRHPKLRINVMHTGYPYLEETKALMMIYPQVYTDLGATDWLLPRAEFHACLAELTRVGLGQRVMFGTDQMFWPEAIGMAVEAVDSATFLTLSEKRNIFHDNAVRFLKLEGEGEPKKPSTVR